MGSRRNQQAAACRDVGESFQAFAQAGPDDCGPGVQEMEGGG